MNIQSKMKNYEVRVTKDIQEVIALLKQEQAYYVIDEKVYQLYPQLFKEIPENRLYLLEALEENKTIDTALIICEKITALDSKRNTHLISIGGGITQDLTGFVANIMYRGIKWSFVPTTLLAAADSCIGGKTSLNYKSFKNLLGTFYPPDEILICPEFFQTLSDLDLQSGLGEVVKFNVMMGKEGLSKIKENLAALLARDKEALYRFVEASLAFKKTFIEEDEFDAGKRIYLNFAHTFGHAFEVSSHYSIPHGTAVAMGMLAAGRVSCDRGMLTEATLEEIQQVVSRVIGLKISHELLPLEPILKGIRKDKKQTGTNITAILFDEELTLHIVDDLKEVEIEGAVQYVLRVLAS